ncbi:Nn.00g101630.m01.CDS01 [Neocucurbitaria sp. VM-36]
MTIGGGISTGEFANATYLQGMEVTVGSCPCTGVMGVALGAGIGRLQGRYGYLHDNILSLRLLLANGTVVEASQDNHPDIYWAVRGAGHNFGIVLSAAVQVYPQKHEGLHLVVDFEFAIDRLESVFEILNDLASPMPENIAIFVIGRKKGASGSPTISIDLVVHGPRSDATAYIAKFASLSPVFHEEKVVSWNSLPWATYRGLNNILCTPEGWARYPIKHFSAANVKSYDIQTMRSFFDSWVEMNEKYDGQAMFSLMFESFPQQGVRRKDRNSTAYPWRFGSDHFLMIEVASKTLEHEDVYAKWLSEQQEAFVATSGYGRLQQYVNYGNGHSDPPEALYGYEPWRLERLRKIKSQLDPEGLFNGYQPFVLDLQ